MKFRSAPTIRRIEPASRGGARNSRNCPITTKWCGRDFSCLPRRERIRLGLSGFSGQLTLDGKVLKEPGQVRCGQSCRSSRRSTLEKGHRYPIRDNE